MGRQSQDVVVRFVGDTGNLAKGMDGLQGRFRAVTGSLEGIAKAGAVVGALAFFKNAIDEAREAARVTRQTEAVLRSTGNAANVTADHVAGLAGSLSELVGVDDEVIQHGENVLLTFTKVRNEIGEGNDVFDQATKISLDMSAALNEAGDAGAGLQETAIRIGKALNDPVKGMTALQKVGVTFTADQKEQIKNFVAQGDVLSAQKIILAELKTEFGGMAEASADASSKAQVAFANFAEEVGLRVLPAVNAVSDWAVNTGIPALTKVADTTLDVAVPAAKALVDTGKDVVHFFTDLPGPIQAGALALLAWKFAGDKVISGLGQATGPLKSFGDEMRLQAQLAKMSGDEVGQFGVSLATLEARTPAIGAVGSAFRDARGEVGGFAATVRGVGAASFTALKGAAAGLVGFLGGPWGAALVGATVGLGFLIAKSQQAEARQRELADAGKTVAQALREQNGVINENVRQVAAKALEDKHLLKPAQDLGISLPKLTDALLDQGSAAHDLRAQLENLVDVNKIYATTETNPNELTWTGALTDQGLKAKELLDELNRLIGGKDEDVAATQRQTQAAQENADSQQALKLAQDAGATSSDMLKDAVESLGGKFDDTKTDGQHLVEVIKGLTEAQTTAIDLAENYEAALDGLTESIKNNGKTLDIHTDKGRNNRDALENAATAIRDMTLADIESGVPAQEAVKRHDDRVRALQAEANKAGFARGESELLIGTYSRIPPNVRTIIETQGYEETYAKLKELNLAQRALAEGISIRTAHGLYGNEPAAQRASGGLITGPGGPTSDAVPIWASNREYVQRAAAVDYYGVATMNAMNQQRIPREVFAGYAGGGLVGWPFPVNVAKTKIPAFGSAINVSGIGGIGVSRWAPLVLAVLAMLGQSSGLLPNVLRRMNQESGGNPNAINLTDINAQRGDPSRGLMQTIGSTFNAYAGPFIGRGIYDPLANIYAGLNYAIHRYGSLQYAMDKPGGYRNGGWLMPGQVGVNETSKPEAVFTQDQLRKLGRTEKHYHLNAYVTNQGTDVREQFRRMELLELG